MIYLDNASTTLMKPRAVADAMHEWMQYYSANCGRGGHKLGIYAGDRVYECRCLLAQLFNIEKPENIIFTGNTTMALNIAIKGRLKRGDHVVIGGMEHNSVYRPVVESGCAYTVAKADAAGSVTAEEVKRCIQPTTKLIVINHGSNIVGTVSPIRDIGELADSRGIPFLVDAAQTAGVMDIDVQRDHISMLAFAGHKMLFGPTGTGGLYIDPKLTLRPLITGGTGSMSDSPYQPDFLPDRFESGTLNIVGIVGLAEGVKYVLDTTPKVIRSYEEYLTDRLLDGLQNIRGVRVYGGDQRVGVVGFRIDGTDSVTACNLLDEEFNIAARGGYHCAILAHRSMGTDTGGLVRLSMSCFNNRDDVDDAIYAVYRLIKMQ